MGIEITRVVPAVLYGFLPRSLALRYVPADPVAIHLECSGHRWEVARARVLNALSPTGQVVDYEDEGAAAVHILRLPDEFSARVLLILRARCGRWPLTVGATELTEFLAATYLACPKSHEQRVIERELEAQINLFHSIPPRKKS